MVLENLILLITLVCHTSNLHVLIYNPDAKESGNLNVTSGNLLISIFVLSANSAKFNILTVNRFRRLSCDQKANEQ